MKDSTTAVIGLVVLAILFLLAPVGVRIYQTWQGWMMAALVLSTGVGDHDNLTVNVDGNELDRQPRIERGVLRNGLIGEHIGSPEDVSLKILPLTRIGV